MATELVLSEKVVASAAKRLRGMRAYRAGQEGIHSNFTGYMAALAAIKGKDLPSCSVADVTDFMDRYLRPSNGTRTKPYYFPWARTGSGWFNQNVAGSYASSSRPDKRDAESAFRGVLDFDEDNRVWKLRPDHAEAARRGLLGGTKAPALPMAIFLLKDFGFPSKDATPAGLVASLRLALGLDKDDETFQELFSDDEALPTDAFVEVP